MLFIAALCGSLLAQNDKTITVRMLDSRTGKLIATSDFLVRVNHDQTLHGNWIVQNDDGTGKLTVPADAAVLSVQATYDSATMVYVNCDTNKDLGSSDHAAALDHWYPISAILASGVVAPNGCAGKKIPEKLQVVAKPGEFVFFVRKRNTREEFKD
jgi:adhesin HecA-like repeat protein